MPPKAVKTVEDEIYWQYAQIISNSAGFGKSNYGFIMSKFKELKNVKNSLKIMQEETLFLKFRICLKIKFIGKIFLICFSIILNNERRKK